LRHFRLLIKGAGLADIKLSGKSDGELLSCHLQAIGLQTPTKEDIPREKVKAISQLQDLRVRRIYIPLGFEENLLYIVYIVVVINNVNIFFLHIW
jgi:hypothetical protein